MKSTYFFVIISLLLSCRFAQSHLDTNITNADILNNLKTDNDISLMVNDLNYNTTNNIEDTAYNVTYITFESYLEYIHPRIWTWVLIAFHSIVFVIGLLGNCLVCVAVYKNHSMRTVTNYFIANLALADFMVILFCLPPSVIWDVTSTWWFGTHMCQIVLYMQSVSVIVSVLTLTFISIDRWYAICFPLKFKSTTNRAKTAICIIWIIAMGCELPEPLYLTAVPYHENYLYLTQCEPTWSIQTELVFVLIKMIFFYIIPLLFMSVAYLQIIRVLWKSGRVPHLAMDFTGSRLSSSGFQLTTFTLNMNTSTESQLRTRKKAAKMLVAVVTMFAFCFFPVYLLSVLRVTVQLSNSDANIAFSLISHWLCYANSAINPIIYNFMSGKFRKEFRRAFDSCLRKRNENSIYYRSRGTQCNSNKESGLSSRTTSKNDCELRKLNAIKNEEVKLFRKNTRSSVLQMDV